MTDVWDEILDHCGRNFKCSEMRGHEFLKQWLAWIVQQPCQRLPYLYFHGPEDTGKSMFHEAAGVLFGNSYVLADCVLFSTFNNCLESAKICALEEYNTKGNYSKLNNYCKDPTITIDTKGAWRKTVPNMTHWIQCCIKPDAVPECVKDITVKVPVLFKPKKIVPKQVIKHLLAVEAERFLFELWTLPLKPLKVTSV